MHLCIYKDHLSTETSVSYSMGHLSDTNEPLYKDHLSEKTHHHLVPWVAGMVGFYCTISICDNVHIEGTERDTLER